MKQKMWESACKYLPGRKYLILGNHDNLEEGYYEKLGFKVLPPFIQKIGIFKILFSHYPVEEKSEEWDFNFHGHIHNHVDLGKQMEYHRNCSIEVMNYRPIEIGDVI
jgi:calcineurin-like phosphoesterase family protein